MKLQGKIISHNTKASTKEGVEMLKVGVELENLVGGEAVSTMCTFAVRATDLDKWPIDRALEVVIGTPTK